MFSPIARYTDDVLSRHWVSHLVGERQEIFVALDWTEFAKDDHSTIAAYLLINYGRATPLMWKTHGRSTLKAHRNDYEDALLVRLREHMPEGVRVTVLADRGFGDQALYTFIKEELQWDYIIRFKGNIMVTDGTGESRQAKEWVFESRQDEAAQGMPSNGPGDQSSRGGGDPRQEEEGAVVPREQLPRTVRSRYREALRQEIHY